MNKFKNIKTKMLIKDNTINHTPKHNRTNYQTRNQTQANKKHNKTTNKHNLINTNNK